ncbi:hypothetical protein [Amycolatopsis sp. lyj-112]|uniref:hypothetical protein n=1 Tax=Amycolatopsis sp. lyj-112 TaxID=2789288 RepID=UPI00397C8648
MNWIECEFTAVRYFTLDGSDYPSHAAQQADIAGYLRWRNATPRHIGTIPEAPTAPGAPPLHSACTPSRTPR